MTKDEALKMAIEALEDVFNWGDDKTPVGYIKETINACKEALEQQEASGFFERGKAIAKWADEQNKQLSDDDIQQITWQIWGCDALEPELDFARAIEKKVRGE